MKNSSKIKFILTILFFSLLIFLSVSKVYADTCECAVDGSYYCYTCSGDSHDADGNYRCDWISGSDDNAWCCWYTSWENNSSECGGGDDDDDSCTCDDWTNDVCGGGTCTETQLRQLRDCTPDQCNNEFRCLDKPDYCAPSCTCDSSWTDGSCGGGSCASDKRQQTRDCNPDGCDSESQCVTDPSCECVSETRYCERCSDTYDCQRVGWSYDTCEYSSCQDALEGYDYDVDRWEDPACYFDCYDCDPECPPDYPLTSPPDGPYSSTTVSCDKISSCDEKCGEKSRTCYKSDCTGCDCNVSCGGTYPLTSCSWPNCQSTSTCCTLRDSCNDICSIGGSSQKCITCYRCVPGLCTGCTPSCPSGQSTTVSGPLCAQNLSSCTGNDGCGSSCTRTGNRCYLPETNTTPSSPSSLTMTIDGVSYILDTSSSSPKVVKYPTFNNTPTISIPSRSTPSTARDLTYDFQANNEGYNNPEWTNFGCSRGEDFCIDDLSTNQTNFTPNSEPLEVVLEQGASGGVNGRYATLNKCDDNLVHSDFLSTYYMVNNLPEDPVPPEPDVGICPTITNDTLEKDQRGCNSAAYTGIETNNPLKFKLSAYDEDGNDEIQGAIVWLSKEGKGNEIPDRTNISSLEDYSGSNSDHLAVMILKNGDSWDNTFVYVLDESLETWVRRDTITNTQQEEIAQIVNVEASQTTEEVIFELEVNFNEVAMDWDGEYPEGMYEINGLVFDEHMILGDFTIDQYEMLKDCRAEGSWGIDLRVPTFDEGYPEKAIKGPELLDLLWALDGTGSNLTDIVINGYGSNPSEMEDIDSDLDQGTIILESVPGTDEIGILEDPRVNSWRISSINENPHSGEIEVDMGENDRHSITMYVTGYDQACNYVLGEEIIDLNPWITTYGGMIYSEGNISGAKEIEDDQEALFEGLLEKIPTPVYQNLDVGTELVSSRGNVIGDLIRPSLGAVRASRIQDSNSKKSFWFDYLKSKLQSQIANEESGVTLQEISSPTDACVADGCYMLSEENIVIPSGYTCDKNILLMTEGNITMEPNITSAGVDTIQGCILVARGNIYIGEGEYQSQPGENLEDLGYDYIDAFMIAENQIEIELVDEDKVIRDGLEVHGGMAAFGRDLDSASSAISINRSLRLFNTFVPTVVTSWTPRYAKLSEIFFGTSAVMYKQEVGFKPY